MQIVADLRKLQSELKKLPTKVLKSVSLEVKRGAKDIQNHARQNHRYISRTGRLDRSIVATYKPAIMTSMVGIDKSNALYGIFQHDGTKKNYPITPKKKKALRWVGSNGKFAFSKKIIHPGIKKDPFITKAGKYYQPIIKARINQGIRKALSNG